MRYIRMKNKWSDDFEGSEIVKEVYQIYNVKKGDDMNLWAFDFEGFPYCITEDMIIAQADTIEELCDCYSYYTETTKDIAVARGWKKYDTQRKIYGCILTDKGLIYVAKMNDKGELELL